MRWKRLVWPSVGNWERLRERSFDSVPPLRRCWIFFRRTKPRWTREYFSSFFPPDLSPLIFPSILFSLLSLFFPRRQWPEIIKPDVIERDNTKMVGKFFFFFPDPQIPFDFFFFNPGWMRKIFIHYYHFLIHFFFHFLERKKKRRIFLMVTSFPNFSSLSGLGCRTDALVDGHLLM